MRFFTRAKLIDLAWGFPLLAWYAWALWTYAPGLFANAAVILRGEKATLLITSTLAQFSSLAFAALLIGIVLFRMPAVSPTAGVWPRIVAIAGTFAALLFARIPLADLSAQWNIVAALLIFTGFGLSFYVLTWLGRSFSIVPEARKLVTHGPYGIVRHPLYVVEEIAIIGIAMQYALPWSLVLFAVHLALQLARMEYEERVLAENFPEYAAYAARVKRLIPGVY